MFKNQVLIPFLAAAENHQQCSAFCIEEKFYSYHIFVKRIAAISKGLEKNQETFIGLAAHDDLDTYASIFAIWFTNKAYVPLNMSAPAERNRNIIDQIGLQTLLNSELENTYVEMSFEESIAYLKSCLTQFFDNELAYVFFTSGSTGIPKGVEITKNNVASFCDAFWKLGYHVNEQDRCLQMFELTFDLSVMSFLIPLLQGACVFTIPKNRMKYSYIFMLMDEYELTIALMVPSILNYLRPYFEEIDCSKMKYSLFCGEALHTNIIEEWSKCLPNAQIDNVYGPTENTIFCTSYSYKRNQKNDEYNGVLSIGKPMENNLALIIKENEEFAEVNEVGELCLAGAQLTPGYYNNDIQNMASFFFKKVEGQNTRLYRTGDLCVQRKNGNIEYVGRKDFQVKIQGFRVELSEVEFYAAKLVEKTLVALAIKNSTENFEIALVYESEEFDLEKTKEFLKSKLPSYMLPTHYHFIQPFPLNVNGKIDRKELTKMIQQ